MSPEESIRIDASTVHRTGDSVDGLVDPALPEVTGGAVPADTNPADACDHQASNAGSGSAESSAVQAGTPSAPSHSEAKEREESDQIADAKTVIRGSSRHEHPGSGPEPAGPEPAGPEPIQRSPAAVAKVLLGQHLNHFLLQDMIGGGGMGAVFRAHDDQLDRTVAVKVIPFVGDDPDLQRRFRNEAQSAAKLDHPRIARVFDVGSHGEWHYIVFEYIEGTNIRDLVSGEGVLSIDDAVFFTAQLAEALQHAAERGIVHRDIKPSNVLIGPEGKVKLVDMGLARSDNFELSEDMTASGVTLGTFDYISPEQAHDPRDADLRSDIYSLGCTLYFMLTGNPPYPGGTMLQKLLSHGNAPPPDARQLRPEISDNLVAVIQKMLAKKPSERYQTAADLMADLREVAFRDGLSRSQSMNPVTITPERPIVLWMERHAPWLVAAVLLILVAGWLQLESAAFRGEVIIPIGARSPQTETVAEPAPVEETSLDSVVVANPEKPLGNAADLGNATTFGPPEEPPRFDDVPVPEDWSLDQIAVAADQILELPSLTMDPFSELNVSQLNVSEPNDPVSSVPMEPVEIGVVRLVSPDDASDADLAGEGIVTATTLGQALQLATEYENTSRIEIAVPIVICSEPVRLEVDDLLITSTVGGSQIVFQPLDSVAMARSKMLSIGSHSVVFEDLHFTWNVPSGDLDGGTLFELHANDLVRFTDCSITVNNPTLREEVYAFDVITDPNKLPRPIAPTDDEFPHVWLELNNVIVRGQITMLHMDYAAKLWLDWDNGLLSVTQRMIDTAGARLEPAVAAGPIRLKLWRVTVHAPQGVFLMRVGVSGAYPVPVDRWAHECVFLVDAQTPHFDFRGLTNINGLKPLRLQGASNAYVTEDPLADPMLRLLSSDQQIETTLMDEILTATPSWAMDKSPSLEVDWLQTPRNDLPTKQRGPSDYRQRDESPLGFDEKALPTLPNSTESAGETI